MFQVTRIAKTVTALRPVGASVLRLVVPVVRPS